MTTQEAALILLMIRILTLVFMGLVVYRQYKLLQMSVESEIVQFRIVFFMLGLVFTFGSFIPVGVDIYYAFIYTTASWNPLLVIYAASNALSSLAGAVLMWQTYRIAGRSLDIKQKEGELHGKENDTPRV